MLKYLGMSAFLTVSAMAGEECERDHKAWCDREFEINPDQTDLQCDDGEAKIFCDNVEAAFAEGESGELNEQQRYYVDAVVM